MKATKWEFENRGLMFGMVFGISFPFYALDKENSTAALAQWIALHVHADVDLVTRLLFVAAAVLLIVAALIRTWAASYLRATVVYAAEVKTATLVADGPYRRVRNPLYFGNVLLAVGVGAMMSRPGVIVAVVAMVLVCYRLIFREEAEFKATQGESYDRYRRAVPRLWPSVIAKVPSSGRKPQWAAGFRSESWYWGIALAAVVFSITFSLKLYFYILGLSIALLWGMSFVLGRKPQKAD